IQISEASVKRLLLSPAFTSSYQRIAATLHGLNFPLKFPSPLAELNLLSILSLVNIGSGYRVPLHEQTGRGAWDSIRAFVFGLYLTSSSGDGDLLSARGMLSISDTQIAELLGVNIHVEKPHESISGLTIGGVGGPGWELVQHLKNLLHGTGQALVEGGYRDLGSFVAEALLEGQRAAKVNDDQDAAEILVRAIPGFQDMAVVNGQNVYCFKKALFLTNGLTIRFGSLTPPPFPIPRTSHLPVFTDNVLPSMLVHLGVIDLSSADLSLSSVFPDAGSPERLQSLLGSPPEVEGGTTAKPKIAPKEGPVLNVEQAYVLRAASIDACEIIVDIAHNLSAEELRGSELEWIKGITLPDLDSWIWGGAKDRQDYRDLRRFVLRDTIFF
ncbi:hypothetical protein OF83DRAFT_1052430, partial [Amylostereum chailletii]